MKKYLVIILVLLVAGVLFWSLKSNSRNLQNNSENNLQVKSETLSDGTLTYSYASTTWGLATNQNQVLVHSYIPPCNPDFDYCFYYTGNKYEGTNFESAGIRINKRTDLANERVCMQTPPEGFDATKIPSISKSENAYASSVFSNIGDVATGHYASSTLYRLFVRKNNSCYEFETRIGQSRYENYPEGAIQKFTLGDEQKVEQEFAEFIKAIALSSGQKNLF